MDLPGLLLLLLLMVVLLMVVVVVVVVLLQERSPLARPWLPAVAVCLVSTLSIPSGPCGTGARKTRRRC